MPSQDSVYKSIELSEATKTLASRLEEAEIGTKRFIEINDQKKSYDHTKHRPAQISSDKYGVMADGDLVILDVDEWTDTPENIRRLVSETPTFTVESPHAEGKEGHYYFKCVGDVPTKQPDWGEIRGENCYVLGPGSVLESCAKSYHDCSLPGRGIYSIRYDRPIATISPQALLAPDSGGTPTESAPIEQEPTPSPDLQGYEEELAEVGHAILRDLKAENTVSHATLTTLLEGGVSRYTNTIIVTDEQGEYVDRDQQENLALLFLYGTIRQVGNVEDDDRAKRILFSTFHDYMGEYPRTSRRGRKRKWIERGSDYRANRIGAVLEDFEEGRFIRFLNISNTPTLNRFKRQQCSEVNFNFARFAVDLLSGLWDTTDPDRLSEYAQSLYKLDINSETLGKILSSRCPGSSSPDPQCVESIDPMQNRERLGAYPTNEDLFTVVNELGSSISSKDSFSSNVLSELQETGMVKHAYCPTKPNGRRHVYYPSSLPDPDDALWVRTGGEQTEKD